MGCGGRCAKQIKGKAVFFEKKKQKTSARWHARNLAKYAMTQGQKFFASFFQKRRP
jgi:hypothetical protein